MFDDLLKKMREDNEKLKALNDKLQKQVEDLKDLNIQVKQLGEKIKRNREGKIDILN